MDRDPVDELAELPEEEVEHLLGTWRDDVAAAEGALDAFDLTRRSLLASALAPSLFPATTSEVVAMAELSDLEEDMLEAIRRLPSRQFATVQEVWVAIGGAVEHTP